MNIGQVGGNGSIDRGSERPIRIDRNGGSGQQVSKGDQAAISATGREAAATFDALVRAAATDEPGRTEKVDQAEQRLIDGDLDLEAVYRGIAEQLLGNDFRAV